MSTRAEWSRRLGAELVCDEATIARYESNASGLCRRIAGVVRPATTADVARIVRMANEIGGTLYPISTGASWGLGSKLPVRDGAVVLDLSGLDRIASIDARLGVAVIEPGVTQRRLADAVASTPFRLDVTGSGADTSVLGNALDRGIAHDGPRALRTRVLEVVLGTGEIATLDGHGSATAVTALYRLGLGPALHELFFQSSYGIVTRAAIQLEPRTADVAVLACALEDERRLPDLVDAARRLVDAGVFRSIHLSNRARRVSVLGGLLARSLGVAEARRAAEAHVRSGWALSATLRGEPEMVRVAGRIARRELAPLGTVTLTRPRSEHAPVGPSRTTAPLSALRRAALVAAELELFGHACGVPSDGALASVPFSRGRVARPLDAGETGTLFVLPLVPMDGQAVAAAVAIAREVIEDEHRLIPFITLNGFGRVLEMVVNVTFDKHTQAQTAHAAADELLDRTRAAGYPPYRVGIQHMSRVIDRDASSWQLAARLKDVLDPRRVLAPGRYDPG